jgi:hypothetical protein
MVAKFVTTLESQHVHTQALIDIKSIFLRFLGGQKHPTKIVEMELIVAFEWQH